jgi:alkylation response protein AidB-like acyl-CoA dehydrogenase
MDFTLNEEQEMLKKSVQDFLKNECGPKVLKELEESETGFSRKLWESMAGLGWMGIIVPEAYDGVGLTLLDLAVLFEAYGRAALNGPMLGTVMGTLATLECGSDDVKAERLPQVVSGQRVWTFAMEEAEVAYDPGCVATRAVSTDRGYKIQGTKLFVPYANVADDLFVVARTEGSASDEGEIAIFVVNKDAPGIQLAALKPIAGDKQFQVDFQDVPVSPEDRLGAGEGGLDLVLSILGKATAIQCAEMVGGAEYELEITAEYCRTRVQFDRPIGTFQAVQHRLADMYMDVLGARLTTYQALWRLSEGMPAGREVAIAKAFTSKAVRRVAFSAQQLHAGMGYDLDHELHYYYCRAKALELKMGTVPAHLRALHPVLGP